MRLKLFIAIILSVYAYNNFRPSLRRLLYGPVWESHELCASRLDPKRFALEDEISEKLINGSILEEFEHASRHVDVNKINRLIYDSIVARNTLNVNCNLNNWSYADNRTRQLSNPVEEDPRDCECRVGSLLSAEFVSNSIAANWSTGLLGPGQCRSNVDQASDYLTQLNSFGRVPSGPLYFNELWLGDYDSCAKLKSMHYCLGSYNSRDWRSLSADRDDFRGIRIGMCLPRTCGLESFSNERIMHKINRLVQSNLVGVYGFSDPDVFSLDDVYCLPTDDSEWMSPTKDSTSIFLLTIASIWVALLVYATVARPSNALEELNLGKQLKNFITHKDTGSFLPGINAVKVIDMVWIVYIHSFLAGFIFYQKNIHDADSHKISPLIASTMTTALHAVPNFFLLSGLMSGLHHLQQRQDPLRAIMLRYMRLMPTYIVIYAYAKKFRHLIGSGPLWDYGVSAESENRQCMLESWFVPLLMVSNQVHPMTHCIPTGFNLAIDFQVHLILLMVLFPIYRRSKTLGRFVALAGFIASHLLHIRNYGAADSFNNRQLVDQSIVFGASIVLRRMGYDYISSFGRLGTYCLGVLLADMIIVSRTQCKQHKDGTATENCDNDSISQPSNTIEWISDNRALLFGVSMMAIQFLPLPPDPIKSAMFSPHMKGLVLPASLVMMDIGNFALLHYLFVQLPTKLGNQSRHDGSASSSCGSSMDDERRSWPDRVISSKYWCILSKLNFCVMMLHPDIVRYFLQSQRELFVYSQANVLAFCFKMLAVTYSVSFVVHIIVEMPITYLMKKLL